MLVEYVKVNYYARFHYPSYQRYRERQFSVLQSTCNLTKAMEHETYVKGTRSWYMLVENVKYNNYIRFHDPSYHRYRERHFSVLLEWKF